MSAELECIQVLLADDHRIVRQAVVALLKAEEDIEIIGEAADGQSAIAMAKELSPDVIIMDVAMPGLGGVEATRQTMTLGQGIKVIALTGHSDEQTLGPMLRAGAAGFVVKQCSVEELVEAIHTVVSDGMYVSPTLKHAMEGVAAASEATTGPKLSPREMQVLRLMADGSATKEVARALGISIKTAETHRRAIMDKVNIDNVAGLTNYAIRVGLTTIDQPFTAGSHESFQAPPPGRMLTQGYPPGEAGGDW